MAGANAAALMGAEVASAATHTGQMSPSTGWTFQPWAAQGSRSPAAWRRSEFAVRPRRSPDGSKLESWIQPALIGGCSSA